MPWLVPSSPSPFHCGGQNYSDHRNKQNPQHQCNRTITLNFTKHHLSPLSHPTLCFYCTTATSPPALCHGIMWSCRCVHPSAPTNNRQHHSNYHCYWTIRSSPTCHLCDIRPGYHGKGLKGLWCTVEMVHKFYF